MPISLFQPLDCNTPVHYLLDSLCSALVVTDSVVVAPKTCGTKNTRGTSAVAVYAAESWICAKRFLYRGGQSAVFMKAQGPRIIVKIGQQ